MINKIIHIIAICSVLALGWGCSSDNNGGGTDTTPAEKPNWQMSLAANDAAPEWNVVNAEDYELTMSMAVKLNTVLAQYASNDDLLAAFVAGTCRSVTSPTVYAGNDFALASASFNIIGNAGESGITFKYYCKRLNRIFTLEHWMDFNPNLSPSQDGAAYVLPFETDGGMMGAQVTIQLPEGTTIDREAGDEIAMLSDSKQCCSQVVSIVGRQVVLNVLAPQGSRLTIDWYSAAQKAILEAAESLTITNSEAKAISVSAFNAKK